MQSLGAANLVLLMVLFKLQRSERSMRRCLSSDMTQVQPKFLKFGGRFSRKAAMAS